MTNYKYFWVRLAWNNKLTIARQEINTSSNYPWEIIASDEIFPDRDIVKISEIEIPQEIPE